MLQTVNYYTITSLFNATTSLVLCWFVFTRNPDKLVNRTFAFFSFCVATWAFFHFLWQFQHDAKGALFCHRALMAGAIFIPSAYLHFVCALLGIERERR